MKNPQMRQSSSEYRKRAEQCEARAALARDPGEKAHYQELVRQWRTLADKTAKLEARTKSER